MSAPYVTRGVLATVSEQLTVRDRAALVALDMVNAATTHQLRRLVGPQGHERGWQRTLARLTRDRLITRLDRRVGGITPGSAPWIYTLDIAGQRLLGRERPRRPTTSSTTFLRHTLLVTELAVLATELTRTFPLVRIARFTTEPDCWRRLPEGAWLKPDADLVLAAPGMQDHYFLEADLGTESGPALDRKLRRYARHWSLGQEQERRGVYPRVVFVTMTDERADQVAGRVRRVNPDARRLFAVTTLTAFSDFLMADLPKD
jgi:hypothetical protein